MDASAEKQPYPRPMLTVDVVLLSEGDEGRRVLLIQRGNDPFAGAWALPGGFVEESEQVAAAARRELMEETGAQAGEMSLLGVFDAPGRDPRGWTVSVVYVATVQGEPAVTGADDASDARWFDVGALPELAFDHAEIVSAALARSRS